MTNDNNRITPDGLPIITGETISEITQVYSHRTPGKWFETPKRLEQENPELYALFYVEFNSLSSGREQAIFQKGMELTYEALRRQSQKANKEAITT